MLVIEPVFFGKLSDFAFGEIKLEAGVSEAQKAAIPDLQCCILVKFGIVEADVDAGSKRFVEFADTVDSEDDNAGEVFEDSKEDCRKFSKYVEVKLSSSAEADLRRGHSL